ncbi:flagellar associated protein [Haematococcus lacustris]
MSNTQTSKGTKELPFSDERWKIPGYTGYIHGLGETYKKTPIMAQLEVKDPEQTSFLHTRDQLPFKDTHATLEKDPCNYPENFRKPQPDNLWPRLLTEAKLPSAKPPVSNIPLGDQRVDPFQTSYGADFTAPFADTSRLRSPNRNEDLSKTTASLKDIYRSSFNRVGDKRLEKMISTMRDRMDAKCGNSNDNAFRLRKLFLAHDTSKSGLVHFEDLRQMCESFGMQLDDDSLLALYYVYDPEGTGYLNYMDLVKHLMSPDSLSYYLGFVDTSQNAADMARTNTLLASMHGKVAPVIGALKQVLDAFDTGHTGYLGKQELLAGCASLGVVLADKELTTLTDLLRKNAAGQVEIAGFVEMFSR